MRRVLAMELMRLPGGGSPGRPERLGKGTPLPTGPFAPCAPLWRMTAPVRGHPTEAVLWDGSLVRAVEKAAGEIEL